MSDKKPNRVWIELDKPRDAAHAQETCDAANRMLQRLDPGTPLKFWPGTRCAYNLTLSQAQTYTELADNGHWFNLDHLGRAS